MIFSLRREASKDGIPNHKFSAWVHRKYGKIVIWRVLYDGSPGLSYPCVLCRKTLERSNLEWIAHLGDVWYSSKDPNIPKSKPTHKQYTSLNFSRVPEGCSYRLV